MHWKRLSCQLGQDQGNKTSPVVTTNLNELKVNTNLLESNKINLYYSHGNIFKSCNDIHIPRSTLLNLRFPPNWESPVWRTACNITTTSPSPNTGFRRLSADTKCLKIAYIWQQKKTTLSPRLEGYLQQQCLSYYGNALILREIRMTKFLYS